MTADWWQQEMADNYRDARDATEHLPQPDRSRDPWFVPRRSDWEMEMVIRP